MIRCKCCGNEIEKGEIDCPKCGLVNDVAFNRNNTDIVQRIIDSKEFPIVDIMDDDIGIILQKDEIIRLIDPHVLCNTEQDIYGNLMLTNRRLIFDGYKRNFAFPLDKIIVINVPYQDGSGIIIAAEDKSESLSVFNPNLWRALIKLSIEKLE